MTQPAPNTKSESSSNPRSVLQVLWDRIDARDWAGLGDVLDPAARISFPHSGDSFDRDGWVRFNREYPGSWAAQVHDLVVAGEREVSRVTVHDGPREFHVASFATVRDGLITDLVEVWTGEVGVAQERPAPPPEGRL